MRRCVILKDIMLSFITTEPKEEDGQYDTIIGPEIGAILESNHDTIWVIWKTGKREESITMVNAIDIYLADGRIAEIPEEK